MSEGIAGLVRAIDKAVERHTFKDVRGYRYGEILLATPDGIEVFNTTGLNECPAKVWDALDVAKIKREQGAQAVIKNGPHWWVMDSMDLDFGETRSFDGLEARWAATLPPAVGVKVHDFPPYTVFNPTKTGKLVYAAGMPVYELVSPEGDAFVMQGFGHHVDDTLTLDTLPTLGGHLQLAPGWAYRTRTIDEDLVFDYTTAAVTAVADDLLNIYNRVS